MKGYTEENFKAEQKIKELNSLLKGKDKEVSDLKRQVHELHI